MSIDRIAYNNNFTHKNPRAKMLLGFSLLILALVIDQVYIQLGIAAFAIGLMVLGAGISPSTLLGLYKLPLGFILISLIAMTITLTKDISLIDYYIIIGRLYLGTTDLALISALKTLVRSMACISCTYFIATTIPINQIISIFKDLRLPKVFVEQFILIYRYINFFMDEYHDMHIAMELKHANRTRWMQIQSTATIGSKLFLKMMGSYADWKRSLDLKLFDGNFYY